LYARDMVGTTNVFCKQEKYYGGFIEPGRISI
jgi:hypothetical protein